MIEYNHKREQQIPPKRRNGNDACKYGKSDTARNRNEPKAAGGNDRHKSDGSVFYRAGLYPPAPEKQIAIENIFNEVIKENNKK